MTVQGTDGGGKMIGGVKFAGIASGIKATGIDLGLAFFEEEMHVMSLYTRNKVKAAHILYDRKIDNARIEQGDWYNLDNSYMDVFDGIVSFQTLSWLPDFREPTSVMCKLNPRWIALSSLFYNGLVSVTTETQTWNPDLTENRKLYYNVYSIPVVKGFLKNNGYTNFRCTPFNIDVDIPNPGEFRTYTEKTVDGKRIQISGPVLMPWYFIAAEKGVV